MSKIIIHHHEVTPDEALAHVRLVVEQGRISNGGMQYCYATSFSDGIIVFAERRPSGTDTFTVQPDGNATLAAREETEDE